MVLVLAQVHNVVRVIRAAVLRIVCAAVLRTVRAAVMVPGKPMTAAPAERTNTGRAAYVADGNVSSPEGREAGLVASSASNGRTGRCKPAAAPASKPGKTKA